MRITKASAAEILSKLSPRAKQLLAAMFLHKKDFKFKNKKEYGTLTTELILANILRVDWDIMHHDVIFLLERGGRFVVDMLRESKAA